MNPCYQSHTKQLNKKHANYSVYDPGFKKGAHFAMPIAFEIVLEMMKGNGVQRLGTNLDYAAWLEKELKESGLMK